MTTLNKKEKNNNNIKKDNSILNNKEKLLNRKKKIKAIKRGILIFVFMITVLITLCLKLPNFNIKNISIIGNENLNKEYIEKLSGVKKGQNIFMVKSSEVENLLKKNLYIENVKITKKLPNTIKLNIMERKADLYSAVNGEFYIIDTEGIVIDKKKEIKNKNLVELKGINMSKVKLGQKIPVKNEEQMKCIKELSNIIYNFNKDSDIKISAIEINDFIDIKLYSNSGLYIKIGTDSKMEEKLEKAFSILKDPKLKNTKGYIDVSFEGNPIIYNKE